MMRSGWAQLTEGWETKEVTVGVTELAVVGDVIDSSGGGSAGGPSADVGGFVECQRKSSSVSAATERNERGMVSAEWAVGIIAAVSLAGVLIAVITNGPVQDLLLKFVLEVIQSFSGYVR